MPYPSDQTPSKGEVLIAGGGIGGLTAALCLAQAGFAVSVLEQAAELAEVGAGIQLSPNASRVLHHLGLASALDACAFLPEGMEIRAWNTGKLISASVLGDRSRQAYGFPYYHIHRGDLLDVLLAAVGQRANITLRTAAPVEGFVQDDGVVRVTAAGTTYVGGALIGADGIRSVVRSGLAGEQAPTFTGNIAWRALVPAQRLPSGLIRPVGTFWWGPRRHFVCYYVRGGALVNCVCVVEKQGWELDSWTERGDVAELRADFAGWHADIQTLIEHMDPDALYKWALHDRPPMARWGKGLVTLLGDACHPTLPFMAQGAAMAIEDAAVLAGCVSGPRSMAEGLARYETLRRERTARVQLGSRRNARIFHQSGPESAAPQCGREACGRRHHGRHLPLRRVGGVRSAPINTVTTYCIL